MGSDRTNTQLTKEEVDRRIEMVHQFSMSKAEEQPSRRKGIYFLAQGLRGIPGLSLSHPRLRKAVSAWIDQALDLDCPDEDDPDALRELFREVYPEIEKPFEFRDKASVIPSFEAAVKHPCTEARAFAAKHFPDLSIMPAFLSLVMAARDVNPEEAFFLPCRVVTRVFGWDEKNGVMRAARLLRMLVKLGAIAAVKGQKRIRAQQYAWRYKELSVTSGAHEAGKREMLQKRSGEIMKRS